MGYNDWKSEPDSTAILGDIRDDNPAEGTGGTVVNTGFLATYFGQRFIDIASVLGANPAHAASSVYRAGGRSGFPLMQIPSDSPELTNDADYRYCQIEETIADLFTSTDLGNGEQLLGKFTVRMEGEDFYAEWNSLTAWVSDNGKYYAQVVRVGPNISYGTVPNFDPTGADSSAFEVIFESGGGSSGGAPMITNYCTFGLPGSGATYTSWATMLSDVEPYLDSTNQFTVEVLPGFYEMDDVNWTGYELDTLNGTLDRWYQYKYRIPPFMHVKGVDKNTTVFKLDTNDLFVSRGWNAEVGTDSTLAGGNPSIFLASQFSSISNMSINVNFTGLDLGDRFAAPAPITFVPDSSAPYNLFQDEDVGGYTGNVLTGLAEYTPEKPMHVNLFALKDVHFEVGGWGNHTSCILCATPRTAHALGFTTTHKPQSLYTGDYDIPIWHAGYKVMVDNCTVKDKTVKVGANRDYLFYDKLLPYGESFAVEYADLLVNNLYYEYDMVGASADSTNDFVVPGSQHFVVRISDLESPLEKTFNNCTFFAPNMYRPGADSTTHVFNKYSFSYTTPASDSWGSNELELEQYSDFPALVSVIGISGPDTAAVYPNHKSIQFNGCKFKITGANHPQLGEDNILLGNYGDAPFTDATNYASEFCVGVSGSDQVPVEFNNCSFENYFDSPYSGLFVIGLNSPSISSMTTLSRVDLNHCVGKSVGNSFLVLNNSGDEEGTPSFVNLRGGSYTAFKAPIFRTTFRDWNYDGQIANVYSPARLFAQGCDFSYRPHIYTTGSISDRPRNHAPLWTDSTTVGGVFQFDCTADVGIFYDCHFNSPSMDDFGYASAAGFNFGIDIDGLQNMQGNYQYGSFICLYQDSTAWADERFQVIDCKFTSDFIPAMRVNSTFSSESFFPAIVHDSKFYSDTTHADLRSSDWQYYESAEGDNLFSQYLALHNFPEVKR